MDELVEAVFRAPPKDFTKARDALVAALKKAGRADEAKAAKALRRPPLPVWMLNRLVIDGAEGAQEVVRVAQLLGRAIAASDHGAVGRHVAELRAAETKLGAEARALASEIGIGFTPTQERELATLVQALPWSEGAHEEAARGRLTQAPPAVDPVEAMRLAAGAPPPPRREQPEKAEDEPDPATADEVALAQAQAALADAQSMLEEAQAERRSAEQARDRARAEVRRAEEALATAERRFEDTVAEEKARSRAVDAAEKSLAEVSGDGR